MSLVFCDSFEHYSCTGDGGNNTYPGAGVTTDWYGEGYRSGSGLDRKWDGNDEGVSNWNITSPGIYSRRGGLCLTHWGGYSGNVRKTFKETYNGFVFGCWFINHSIWVANPQADIVESHGQTTMPWDLEEQRTFLQMSGSPSIFLCDRNAHLIAGVGFDRVIDEVDLEPVPSALRPNVTTESYLPRVKSVVKFGCGSKGYGTNNHPSTINVGAFKYQHTSHQMSDVHLNLGVHRKYYIYKCVLGDGYTYGYYDVDWHHIEMKVVFHETAGSYEVRLDGSTIYSDYGINTLGEDTGDHTIDSTYGPTINSLAIAKENFSAVAIQDLFLLDTNGSSNNDFLGPDTMVLAASTGVIYPRQQNPPRDVTGTYNQWSGATFPTRSFYLHMIYVHYTTVYHRVPFYYWEGVPLVKHKCYRWRDSFGKGADSDSGTLFQTMYYIHKYTKTQGAAGTFTFVQEDFPWTFNGRVDLDYTVAIQKVSMLKKTDAGTMKLKHRLRIGGVDYDSDEFRLQDQAKYYMQPYDISPATSTDWTGTEVYNLEFGLVVSTW